MKNIIYILFLICYNTAFGQSLKLTTNATYVNAGDLDISGNQITVEATFLMTNLNSVNIVSKHYWEGDNNYLLRPYSFEMTTSTQFYLMRIPFTYEINKWYHVAATYDGATLKYYVNGCLIIQMAATGNLVQNNHLTTIGNSIARLGLQSEQFYGNIDEVRIWNVARTQTEIQTTAINLPNPTTQTGLKLYYKFSNSYTNLQGNTAFNGTAIGSPTFEAAEMTALPANRSITEGLVAYYPFNSTPQDSSGNNNHGTIVGGVTPTADRFNLPNKAYEFGRNRYITVPHSSSLAFINQLTFSAWVSVNSFDQPDSDIKYAAILQKSGNQFHGGGDYQFGLSEVSASIGTSIGRGARGTQGAFTAQFGRWYHIVATWDGNYHRVYVDGKLLATKQVSGTMDNSQKTLYIGLDIDGLKEWFTGKIDDIRIYNRSFTGCEVSELYQKERPITPVGTLVACYNLDNNATDAVNQLNGQTRNVDAALGRNSIANTALKFRGDTSSYVLLPNNSLLRPDTLSVSFWANVNDAVSTQYLFFHRYNSTFNFEAFAITIVSGKFRLSHFPNTNPIDSRISVQTDRWYHLAGVFRGDSLFFYIDGVLEGAAKSNGLTQYMTGRSFVLGGTNEMLYNRPYNGRIDDLRIYSKALTTTDIGSLLKESPMCQGTTSVSDFAKQQFSVFPNPVHDKLTVNLKNTEGSIKATIIDITGRILIQQTIQAPQDDMDVSTLAKNGLYLIRVETTDGRRSVSKFVRN